MLTIAFDDITWINHDFLGINNRKEKEAKQETIQETDEEEEEEEEMVDEAVYELKASQEDINETLRNVVDTYSATTHDTKITDYLKTRITMFTQGSNPKVCIVQENYS